MNIFTSATLLAMLIHELDADGAFDAPKIALYTNDVQPGPGRVLSDFTITDFGGLTNLKSSVYGAPFINDSTQAEARAALLNWLTTAITSLPITAYGWVEVNTGGTVLLRAERFAVPYQFVRSGQEFSMVPRLVFGN